jgi:hypothetical protein
VVITPVWPNLVAQPAIMERRRSLCEQAGGRAVAAGHGGLLAAITPATKLLILNAPTTRRAGR